MSKYSYEFKLEVLLKYAEVTRSIFYYQLNKLKEPDKYKEIKDWFSDKVNGSILNIMRNFYYEAV